MEMEYDLSDIKAKIVTTSYINRKVKLTDYDLERIICAALGFPDSVQFDWNTHSHGLNDVTIEYTEESK